MGLGYVDNGAVETAREIVTTFRCANPDCNATVAQAHAMGSVIFRVMCCPKCGSGSEFENTTRGWVARQLPKMKGARSAPATEPKVETVRPR